MRPLAVSRRLVDLVVALLLVASARSQTPDEVSVGSAAGLLAAIRNPSVHTIEVTDITFDAQDWKPEDSVQLTPGRHVTIKSKDSTALTDELRSNTSGPATIDFGGRWPVITVGSGATLVLQDIVLSGLQSPQSPEVAAQPPSTLRPRGFELWPCIDVRNGSKVVLNNTLYEHPSADCSPAAVKAYVLGQWFTVGASNTLLLPDGVTVYIRGTQLLPLPLEPLGGGPAHGEMWLQNYGSASKCVTEGWSTGGGGSSSASSSSSPPWWVWLLVGVASALIVFATGSAALVLRRSRRRYRQQLSASVQGSSRHRPSPKDFPLAFVTVDPPPAPPPALPPLPDMLCASSQGSGSLPPGVASALRIRFGDLEQIELGELIGRGGYGRVYRARWRGTAVAVKVVEHSVQCFTSSAAALSSPADPPWESVLSTSLNHPNIVQTHRVSTVQLRPISSAASNASSKSIYAAVLAAVSDGMGGGGSDRGNRLAGQAGSSSGAPGMEAAAEAAGTSVSSATRQAGENEAGGMPRAAEGGANAATAEGEICTAAGVDGDHIQQQQQQDRSWQQSFFETWMVLEYCDKGSLANAIGTRKFINRTTGQPNIKALLLCLRDVARGMVYLHASNVIHGDLKADNVLLKSREDGGWGFTCKLADFGLSRLLDREQTQLLTRTCGTIGYMPPELMESGRLTTAADVYSMGILCWELLTCQFAFSSESAAQVFYRVVHLGERPEVPEGLECPPEYVKLMQQCWAADPADRPDFMHILRELDAMVAKYVPEPPT